MSRACSRWSASDHLLLLVLALVTIVVFWPTLRNDFVKWDDEANLLANPAYRGLGWAQLAWMFTTHRLNYIPLAWLSFGVDYVVWGLNPVGYHLTNLLLHVAGVVLFFFVARALLSAGSTFSVLAQRAGAATAALFFAIHPLRVESVAWATERRDVLSGVLFFTTILLYLRGVEARGPRRRWLLVTSVGAYLLALLSKPIVMTLPFVLILLDLYPLRRLAADPRRWLRGPNRLALMEKVPYLLLGVAGAVTAYFTQAREVVTPASSLIERAGRVLYSSWFYVFKTAVPLGLSPLYETPTRLDPLAPRLLVSAVGVVGVTMVVLLLRKKWPAGLALWTYYGVVLAPISGFVTVSYLALAADRYSYLVCLGWAMLVGAGVGAIVDAVRRGARPPRVAQLAGVAVAAWMVGLAILTWHQVEVWRDTESLWRQAVRVDPDCAACHAFLGDALLSRGATLSAWQHLHRAVTLRPERGDLRIKMAFALGRIGMWPEAAEHYRWVLERSPNDVEVRNNLGVALLRTSRPREAVDVLLPAIRLAPTHPAPHVTLGVALIDLGRPAEAVAQFQRALELQPDLAMARWGLLHAYRALGRTDSAREQYEALQTLDSHLAAYPARP